MTKRRRSNLKSSFESLDSIARDISVSLRGDMSPWAGKVLVNSACWVWSERQGKYIGCPYWSVDAFELLSTHGPAAIRVHKLVHEHIVPRTVIIREILALRASSPELVRAALDRLVIACVVTQAEDRALSQGLRNRMPPEFDDPQSKLYQDIWARYRVRGIQWVGPVTWKDDVPQLQSRGED